MVLCSNSGIECAVFFHAPRQPKRAPGIVDEIVSVPPCSISCTLQAIKEPFTGSSEIQTDVHDLNRFGPEHT
jgi:hypothetical protein